MKQFVILVFIFVTSLCFSEDLEVVYSPKNKYVIEKTLGRGAFGIVYQVHDSEGNLFALKKHFHYRDPGNRIIFYKDAKREFEIGQHLDHPNIIKAFDYFVDDEEFNYIVLELVQGKRMQSIENETITCKQGLNIATQLIDALCYAFEAGYIYLDMHPDNVMISDTFEIKLIDVSSFFSVDELYILSSNNPIQANPRNFKTRTLRAEKFNQFMTKHAIIKFPKYQETNDILNYFFYLNFNDYITIINSIIYKSDMAGIKKFHLLQEIKKVERNYEENYNEGIFLPITDYLNTIKEVLSRHMILI